MSKQKPITKTPWKLGDAFGLQLDGGWVDALKCEWDSASPDVQKSWTELLTLCQAARCRSGEDWLSLEDRAESSCGYPEPDYPTDTPHPDPGSEAYQTELERVAPSEQWIADVRKLLQSPAATNLAVRLAQICRRAVDSGIGSLNRSGANKEILRALIWCGAASGEPELIDALRQLAVWSIEHRTAQAKTIGLALAFFASEHSAGALRMIETAAKRPSPKTRFGRYAAHVEARSGITQSTSKERFIPTFDLDSTGRRRTVLGEDGAIELSVEHSKVAVRYFNASGKQVAAAPAAIKKNHPAALEELRANAKALGQLLTIQRDRIESLFIAEPTWELSVWRERYLSHPVVGTFAKRLIWQVAGEPVLFSDDHATNISGEAYSGPSDAKVSLWHPLGKDVKEVEAWRDRLETLGLTQPFKQAYREIYLLTDAEQTTGTYSNRFAAHVLRQSQFRAVATTRGWQTPFLGSWDCCDQGISRRELPEFWVYSAEDEREQHFDHAGVQYITTDQVRFYERGNQEPSHLENVPGILLSEVMRDLDLFVSVASVGNDPTWSDGGADGRYRDYWHRYSFGDLTASAKTRKEVLQRLVPKLKIASQCSFEEKFLVVQGSLRAYKIHLGSGNILMKPNDQYLCIVPKQGDASEHSVLLPFEGDRTLSVIISKAFLLAEDSKIEDPSIVSQIKRG